MAGNQNDNSGSIITVIISFEDFPPYSKGMYTKEFVVKKFGKLPETPDEKAAANAIIKKEINDFLRAMRDVVSSDVSNDLQERIITEKMVEEMTRGVDSLIVFVFVEAVGKGFDTVMTIIQQIISRLYDPEVVFEQEVKEYIAKILLRIKQIKYGSIDEAIKSGSFTEINRNGNGK